MKRNFVYEECGVDVRRIIRNFDARGRRMGVKRMLHTQAGKRLQMQEGVKESGSSLGESERQVERECRQIQREFRMEFPVSHKI